MRNVSANNRLKSFKFCIYTQYTELCILCCCYGDRFVSLVAIMKEVYSNVDGKLRRLRRITQTSALIILDI